MAESNRAVFNRPHVVAAYARAQQGPSGFLNLGEQTALIEAAPAARGRPVLDVGVGTGRTAGLLRLISDDYRAVDYAPSMVTAFTEFHPGLAVHVDDARTLTCQPDGHFGLILFSNNGIDAVSHDDRALVLRRFRELLRPDGVLVLSSLALHGPSYAETPFFRRRRGPGDARLRGLARRGIDQVRVGAALPRALRQWRGIRRRAVRHDGWAVAPLAAHDFALLVHFTDEPRLRDELAAAELRIVGLYAEDGRPVGERTTPVDSFTVVATPGPCPPPTVDP